MRNAKRIKIQKYTNKIEVTSIQKKRKNAKILSGTGAENRITENLSMLGKNYQKTMIITCSTKIVEKR